MVIQIDGINTLNKGAELMLVAILEEINERYPTAQVLINPDSSFSFLDIPKYNLKVRRRMGLNIGRIVNGVLYKLKVNKTVKWAVLNENYSPQHVDMILDASGFKYSDQWDRSNIWLEAKEKYYSSLKAKGIKLVFLTQAFGPFDTENGKKSIRIILDYCSLIFARERISYNYLLKEENNSAKIFQSCDFTFKVKGIVPESLQHLQGAVVIIPNYKMVTHGNNDVGNYLQFLLDCILYFRSMGDSVFLLNHEGNGDLKLCQQVNNSLEEKCEIVTGLAAKEMKGVIGNSKLVISSRFHGVASALSQGVPCLATSWNHKYEMLFENFNQFNNLVNANDFWELNKNKIDSILLNYVENIFILKESKPILLNQIDEMWDKIFAL